MWGANEPKSRRCSGSDMLGAGRRRCPKHLVWLMGQHVGLTQKCFQPFKFVGKGDQVVKSLGLSEQ
jgi:hypothetical protein